MFNDFKLIEGRPVYIQLKEYLKKHITNGNLPANHKLPSTRELSALLSLSRNTVLTAYAELEQEELIYALKGKGHFVSMVDIARGSSPENIYWNEKMNAAAISAEEMDLMKHGVKWEKGMISFNSIAPDEELFDMTNVKRSFMARMSIEGEILLNYGYAKGYRPLMEYLKNYMEVKGVDLTDKDILITNGFTEGLDIFLSSIHRKYSSVLCENPTHYSAIKLFRLHGFHITGIEMQEDGVNLQRLEKELGQNKFDFAYFIPSYHNPTGIVTSSEKRMEIIRLMAAHHIPIVEDGFNEELRYSGSHVAPLAAFEGLGNSVVYIGSFSKILFPGLRVGWILADKELIYYLESIKRARTIHTSTLDQALLYQYLHDGYFEKYLKKAKMVYKKKYEAAIQACRQYLPYKKLSGDGGLHLFIEFEDSINTRSLLTKCLEKGIVFSPGDVFYTNGQGGNTLRLGFSRLTEKQIKTGIKQIGEILKKSEGLNK
ncbi:PLP-dependent aminotransferase family protein [Heyndrickxia acidicola]|uniref:PLP-dependent aminotransferase family protein n=1 Tax=Heyndrickxia acidicola TaxID=209389 RepID=A0ABU6MH36_9BACI|nr:PLP-dependent aminotransferase family protein [Heyndrickxia acidicola]MED1203993.1 PLP-dependent aminotransferase family protein [Heyndrickxia acidicola]